MLINLLEIISSKQFPKYNKQPKIQMQKLENLTFALNFGVGGYQIGEHRLQCDRVRQSETQYGSHLDDYFALPYSSEWGCIGKNGIIG